MKKIHSEPYITDERERWWNKDYIQLLQKRFNLLNCKKVLDLGCGAGHWTKIIVSVIAEKPEIIVQDIEEEWVRRSSKLLKEIGYENVIGVVSDAHQLPFPDNSFDLVTCQTLLMHVEDPKKVIKEMYRVLKPNGKVLVVESENLLSAVSQTSLDFSYDIDERALIFEFWLRYEDGKRKCGEGNNSVGVELPGIFKDVGLLNCQFYLNDKLQPEVTESIQQKISTSFLNSENNLFTKAEGHWNIETIKKYLIASGCSEKRLSKIIDSITLHHHKLMETNDRYITAGVACMIIGYGEKS